MNYHPDKVKISADILSDFLRSPLTDFLEDIPSIGPVSIQKLNEHDIFTPYQLIGAYLRLRGNIGMFDHQDRFYLWLKSIDIPVGNRANIVHVIGTKVNCMIPGIYEYSDYY